MTHPATNESVSQPTDQATSADPSEGTLVTYYQPFYNLHTSQLQGLEALARREDPRGGSAVLPSGILGAGDTEGAMRDLDLHILDDALAYMARRRDLDPQQRLILSVNLSWDLIGHRNFVRDVTGALSRHHVPGDRLLVDLSTDIFRRLKAEDDGPITNLGKLQAKEITFCLDGFTSADLELLPTAVDVPVDIIKLHPRLVADDNRQELTDIAKTVQDAGLPVVAAGVETREQLDLVRELGFEWAQGFLLGEPVDAGRADSHPASLPD